MLTSKQTISTITRELRRSAEKVKLTQTWMALNARYGVGTIVGSQLTLSEHDHQHLRHLLQRDMSFDPLKKGVADLEGDRLSLAGKTRNEKLSGQAVSACIVMVSSPSGELSLASGTYRLPPGATLSVPAEELHGAQRIVLIENLQVMYALDRYRWPEGIEGLPMLFRGSPQFTPAAVTQALAGVHEVICFADYDPQGLMNCLTQRRACAMLLPADETIHRITAANLDKPADFANQQAAREWLSTLQLPPVKRMLTKKLAISQESMAGSELVVYPMKSEDAGRQSPTQAVDFL